VLLDPGVSFGSGSHPTTRMCASLLDHPVVRRQLDGDVLDVGSGSGVLAVAAALVGAVSVTAIDVDPAARSATARAAALNGVADRVHVVPDGLGDLSAAVLDGSRPPFGLVLANVLIPVIEEHAGDLVAVAGPGAVLVVSGLLGPQVDRAVAALAAAVADRGGPDRVEVVVEVAEGEWRTVVFRLGHRAVNPV
jgi:ribosomal protein L11 methyltransferase